MAVIITLESVVCFAYCIAVLRGWFGQQERWWVKPLKWYPSLLVFPVLFYLQTELVFSFPGTSFSAISYAFAAAVVVLFPLLCHLFRLLLPEKEMRLETHFLVSLFVCIIGLLTTVNGNVTYPAVDEPTNLAGTGIRLRTVPGSLRAWGALEPHQMDRPAKAKRPQKTFGTTRTVINSKKS